MLKLLLIFLVLFQSAYAKKITLDDRRKQIIDIVEDELKEVTQLAKQEDFRKPDTLLRISELNLERARLWREVENEQYLSIPTEQRQAINRKDYFKKSNVLDIEGIESICDLYLKDYNISFI